MRVKRDYRSPFPSLAFAWRRANAKRNERNRMLQRILEPEVMDSAEEAIDYNQMDHSAVNQLLVADLLKVSADFQTMLDVGAGTAQIPIELCRRHPSVYVTAIDMADAM